MDCPRDETPLMSARVDGEVVVDTCARCGGLWLDEGELRRLEDLYRSRVDRIPDEPDAMTAALQMAKQKNLPPAGCPTCGDTMVREEYGLASQILVDHCPQGHGCWLDKGELDAIEAFYARERAEARTPVLVEWLRNIWLTRD